MLEVFDIAAKKKAATKRSASVTDTDVLPRTSTEGRRHRPSTKAAAATTKSAAKTAKKGAAKKAKTGKEKRTAHREDRREAPEEMVTDAAPKNLRAVKNNKKNEGKATHALEATPKGKRPSRVSTRGGANHVKPDSQKKRQTTRAVRSPKARHEMRGG